MDPKFTGLPWVHSGNSRIYNKSNVVEHTWVLFCSHRLALIPVWIIDQSVIKVWGEINYSFPNGTAVEVWECISNLISEVNEHVLTCRSWLHYSNFIMIAMASQITGVSIVYSTVFSGADQRKHQSSASLAFVRGLRRWPVKSPHKRPVTRHWPLCGEFTGDRWIPRSKGQ